MRLVPALIFFYSAHGCGNPEGFQLRSEIVEESQEDTNLTEEADEPIMVGGAFLSCNQSIQADTNSVSISCSANFEDPDYIPNEKDLYIEVEGQRYYPNLNGNNWEWVFSQSEIENADIRIKSDLPSEKGKSQKTGRNDSDKHEDRHEDKHKKSKAKSKKDD